MFPEKQRKGGACQEIISLQMLLHTPGILKFGNIILLPSFCCGKSRCYSTSTAKKVLKT
jgi:hypothetical protein